MVHVGLLLAESLLGVLVPAVMAAKTNADGAARELVRQVESWLSTAGYLPPILYRRTMFRLKMGGGGMSGTAYLMRLSLSPTEEDKAEEHGSRVWEAVSARSGSAQVRPGWIRGIGRSPRRKFDSTKREARLQNSRTGPLCLQGKLNVRAFGKDVLFFVLLCGQLHGKFQFALVAENAELDAFLFVLREQLFAQLAGTADSVAVQRGDHVADFQTCLGSGGARKHSAHQDAFAIWRAKIISEFAFQAFRVNAEQRAPR
jgi:hypothetical protein